MLKALFLEAIPLGTLCCMYSLVESPFLPETIIYYITIGLYVLEIAIYLLLNLIAVTNLFQSKEDSILVVIVMIRAITETPRRILALITFAMLSYSLFGLIPAIVLTAIIGIFMIIRHF